MTDLPARLRAELTKLRRYTITELGGHFRLVDDPQGAWVQWADLDALLGALETEPPEQPQRIVELAYQAARDQHHSTRVFRENVAMVPDGHREPFQTCDHPDCRLFRSHHETPAPPVTERLAP